MVDHLTNRLPPLTVEEVQADIEMWGNRPTYARSRRIARQLIAAMQENERLRLACKAAEQWFSVDFSEHNTKVPLKQLRDALKPYEMQNAK